MFGELSVCRKSVKKKEEIIRNKRGGWLFISSASKLLTIGPKWRRWAQGQKTHLDSIL